MYVSLLLQDLRTCAVHVCMYILQYLVLYITAAPVTKLCAGEGGRDVCMFITGEGGHVLYACALVPLDL